MKKQNVLFLCHVEDVYRNIFPPLYIPRLVKAMSAKKYDRIIFLVSHITNDMPIEELSGSHSGTWHEEWEWGWGYDKHCFDKDSEETQWLIGASGHEQTWICPEMRKFDWKNYNVFVGGGSYWECLRDFKDILEHLSVDFKEIDGYCYGK